MNFVKIEIVTKSYNFYKKTLKYKILIKYPINTLTVIHKAISTKKFDTVNNGINKQWYRRADILVSVHCPKFYTTMISGEKEFMPKRTLILSKLKL